MSTRRRFRYPGETQDPLRPRMQLDPDFRRNDGQPRLTR